ncbi:MAG: hypothetical protein ACT4OM_13460 [Actinomycetota bacterium]
MNDFREPEDPMSKQRREHLLRQAASRQVAFVLERVRAALKRTAKHDDDDEAPGDGNAAGHE